MNWRLPAAFGFVFASVWLAMSLSPILHPWVVFMASLALGFLGLVSSGAYVEMEKRRGARNSIIWQGRVKFWLTTTPPDSYGLSEPIFVIAASQEEAWSRIVECFYGRSDTNIAKVECDPVVVSISSEGS